MIKNEVELSDDFKAQATKAISAILLFVVVYFILVLFTIALTVLCVYAGIALVLSMPRLITLLLGIGVASLGFLVLIFLIKFIFKSHKVDRSHLIEIKEAEEPQLFELIRQIVTEVGTNFPKKVYLSADVNASVFYDSSFLSMFLPIKKNLQIGMGLVNCVTTEELKAILAHEFGHFSQRTMKVGSYVYNVNQVIFNMLSDNDSYDKLIQSWASVSGYFSIFVLIAVKIVEVIQWILRKMYEVVNLSYMGLSREMEFHADEIAAGVTGYLPLKTSLLRLDLANHAFQSVLGYYGNKIVDQCKSENVYKEQSFVMSFLAQKSQLTFAYDLPQVSVDDLNKYNHSKLIIKDQWASHPSTEERVARLEKLKQSNSGQEESAANQIFKNIEGIQEKMTLKLFEKVEYKEGPVFQSLQQFSAGFEKEYQENSFATIYQGYYDNKNPSPFELEKIPESGEMLSLDDLFSEVQLDLVNTSLALVNDIGTLEQIESKAYPIKSYDYAGQKYQQKETHSLLTKLRKELEEVNGLVEKNELRILQFFLQQEQKKSNSPQLLQYYQKLFKQSEIHEQHSALINEISAATQFLSYTTSYEEIRNNFEKIKTLEEQLKESIQGFLDQELYQAEITPERRSNFEAYLQKELVYFVHQEYNDRNLEIFFGALNDFQYLVSRTYFVFKKRLLDYQTELL